MNHSTPIRRGLGITASLDAGLARDLAVRCEHLGYHSLWSNDEPGSPGLETLAHFADPAPHLVLGVGVLPLDRHKPIQIAAKIDRLGLDPERLWVGIGSGQLRAPIEIVQRAVAELRELLPEQTAHRRGSHATAAVPRRWRNRRRRTAQLDAARPSGGGAPMGAGRSRRGGTRRPGRRVVRPRRSGFRRGAAAPCRGGPLPQHQRGPSQALRGYGRSARQRRRGRIGTTGGARGTGAVPLRHRSSDRTGARRGRCRPR